MDFKSLKQKLIKFGKDTINSGAKKLQNSSLTISDKKNLEELIDYSKTTSFTNKETGETKTFKHRAIVVFSEENSDFFKKALYIFPVLATKAFSQNIKFRLAKSKIKGLRGLSKYKVKKIPAMVVFEDKKVFKVIEGEENILKLVKKLNLDINKQIDNL